MGPASAMRASWDGKKHRTHTHRRKMVDGTTGASAPSALELQRDAGMNGTASAPAAAVAATSASLSQPRDKLVGPMKQQVVRIEVLGDDKVGKTSLICSLVSRHFSERVPAVLLNVQIPAEENNENVIISITDTSSRVSDIVRVANATKRSDAILLVYDLTRPETIQRLRRWLDLIARHKEVPVVLVGNKDDIKTVVTTGNMMDGLHSNQIRQLTNTYQFAVDGGDCSARNFAQVARAFYYAQKAVLYPVEPLYNGKKRMLEPKCLKAIKRTFRLFDRDRDGLLSREELNEYQQDCFGMRLLATEMDTMMEFLQSTIPEGVKEDGSGVRFEGFVYLWQLFIDRKRPESCWQVLRSLGYDGSLDLEIPPERVTLPLHEDDQSGELTQAAIDFVDGLLRQFDGDKDGNLTEEEVEEIFSICEDTQAPWKTCSAITSPVLYPTTQVADKLVVSRSAWLALWSFVAQENPEKLLETLFYLGYNDKANPAIEFAKGRSMSRQATRIERKVVTSYVYSSSVALKTRLAHALVGRKTVSAEKADVTMTANELEDTAQEDEGEIHIIRAVNAVAYRDAATYLLLTEELSEDEVEKRGDVVCLLFDPLQSESLEAAKATESKLPATFPRLFIGLKPEDVAITSSEWEEATKQAKALGNVHVVEDDKTMGEAFEKLVRTAARPPNARTRRPRSNSLSTATKALVAAAALVGGSALAVRASRDSLLQTLMVLVPRVSASLVASR